jgi:hypothetical protein
MNALTRGILLIVLLALGGRVTRAQTLTHYSDAPAAEAAGAADAANRGANGGAFRAGTDDAELLGAPDAYGDVYPSQPTLGGGQQKFSAGANGQGQGRGATSFEHMLNDPGAPQQVRNANMPNAGAAANAVNAAGRNNAPGAQPQGPANAALQLYGDGTASGATRHEIYKSPW